LVTPATNRRSDGRTDRHRQRVDGKCRAPSSFREIVRDERM
jgi:hypothetical protein